MRTTITDIVICSTGYPQGTFLSPFLFRIKTTDNTVMLCSDVLRWPWFRNSGRRYQRVHDGGKQPHHLKLYISKTKELGLDSSQSRWVGGRWGLRGGAVSCWGSNVKDRQQTRQMICYASFILIPELSLLNILFILSASSHLFILYFIIYYVMIHIVMQVCFSKSGPVKYKLFLIWINSVSQWYFVPLKKTTTEK